MKFLFCILTVCLLVLTPSRALAQDGSGAKDYEVQFYTGENYKGGQAGFSFATFAPGKKVHRMEDVSKGFFGKKFIGLDSISSIKVGRGVKVELFGRKHFQDSRLGKKLVLFRGNTPKLLDWDDEIQSIIFYKLDEKELEHPTAKFFRTYGGYKGNAVQSLGIGFYRAKDGNLLRDNDYAMFSCQKGIIVRVFDKDDDSNKPGEGGEVISHEEVFSKERIMEPLSDWRLKDKISAISIEPAGYRITKTELVVHPDGRPNPVRTTLGTRDTSGGLVVRNASPESLTSKMQLSQKFTETIQRSWSNATEAGIEASASVSVTAGAPGVGEATATATLTARLSNTFTIGNDKSESYEKQITIDVEQKVPPGKSVRIIGVITPEQLVYTYRYTWEANTGSGSAPIKTTEDTVTVILTGSATVRSEGAGDVPIVDGVKVLDVVKTDK